MTIHAHSLRDLRRTWGTLEAPALTDLVGDLEASFVGAPLRAVAPRGLGLIGLPRWWGKRFTVGADASRLDGVNLVRRSDGAGLDETLPMTARIGPSLADGAPALVISYADDAPRPWRWVRDEARPWSDGTLLAMTFLDAPGLRRAPGTPFVLSRPHG